MSISTIETIMERVKTASFESPIAVFTTIVNGKTALNAVFGSTYATRNRINTDDTCLVGVFDKRMNLEDVRRKLITASNSQL